MSLLKKINVFRRKVTKMLTSSIGKKNKPNKPFDSNTNIKRILVSRPNHRLGNQLLVTPLLQELETLFPCLLREEFLMKFLKTILKLTKSFRYLKSTLKNLAPI